MLRRWWVLLVAAGMFLGVMGSSGEARADALKLGTLAPRQSPWGQVFNVWAQAVSQKSNGGTTLDWQWGGTAGDENQMVSSMRSGSLHGAAITAVGLGQIYPSVLVFQMPGAFSSWEKLDQARNHLRGHLDGKFEAERFKVLGWGDVGVAHIMSIGFEVRTPADLSKGGTFTISGDPVGPAMFAAISGQGVTINHKPLSVPEILPALGSSVQIINAPSLAAEQLQWSSRITHITTMATGYGIGALVFSKAAFDGLAEDVRTLLAETGRVAAANLTTRIRNLDAQAFARLKNSKTAVELTEAEKNEWNAKFHAARSALKNRPFDAHMHDHVIRHGR